MNLEIGKEEITIKLSRKNSEQPIIIRNGKKVSFDKLDDARNYISKLIFAKLDGNSVPSFRNLFSILMIRRCYLMIIRGRGILYF